MSAASAMILLGISGPRSKPGFAQSGKDLFEVDQTGADALAAFAREDLEKALAGLSRLFLANDKPAIRKALLRMRYLDKFAEEAKARRSNLGRS